MEIKMEITGIKELIASMSDFEKAQLPYAAAKSLTDTAQMVQSAEKEAMKSTLDRPTPYTLKSIYVKAARKNRLEAVVGFKEFAGKGTPAVKYMYPEIMGGDRNTKRFERALQSKGILPKGMYVVPGAGCQLDAYGNIPQSLIVQIISYFQAFGEQGYRANITPQRKAALAKGSKRKGTMGFEYFVSYGPGTAGGRQHLPAGIYKRVTFAMGSAIKPILMFVKKPAYRKRFPFYVVARKIINEWGMKLFKRNLAEALRTARLK